MSLETNRFLFFSNKVDNIFFLFFQVCKGAPHVVIRMCGGHEKASDAVMDNAVRGLRCLGVARTKDNTLDKWELCGLIAFLDPPRPDSGDTIRECNRLGVAVKMITVCCLFSYGKKKK